MEGKVREIKEIGKWSQRANNKFISKAKGLFSYVLKRLCNHCSKPRFILVTWDLYNKIRYSILD